MVIIEPYVTFEIVYSRFYIYKVAKMSSLWLIKIKKKKGLGL